MTAAARKKAEDAIDAAKWAWKNPCKEPKVGIDQVILRHLWGALERVSGENDKDARSLIHKALCSGALRARTFECQSAIPSRSWESTRPTDKGWLLGQIWFDHDLPGFKGELPVVTRGDAARWLATFVPPPNPGRPKKIDKALAAYEHLYPNGHSPAAWKEVECAIYRYNGVSVSTKTIKRALELKK